MPIPRDDFWWHDTNVWVFPSGNSRPRSGRLSFRWTRYRSFSVQRFGCADLCSAALWHRLTCAQRLKCKSRLIHFPEQINNKPWELKEPGLQSKYRLEKCTNTLSLSCVSPVRENCFRNFLKAISKVSFSNLKYFKYSSATALLKSLLK